MGRYKFITITHLCCELYPLKCKITDSVPLPSATSVCVTLVPSLIPAAPGSPFEPLPVPCFLCLERVCREFGFATSSANCGLVERWSRAGRRSPACRPRREGAELCGKSPATRDLDAGPTTPTRNPREGPGILKYAASEPHSPRVRISPGVEEQVLLDFCRSPECRL